MSLPLTFREAARYNSGSSLCDSGSAYGYHYEQPPVTDAPCARVDLYKNTISPFLETALFLEGFGEVDTTLQKEYYAWAEPRDGTWFELMEEFLKKKGYVSCAKDNTYNGESDLTQCLVWEVWKKEDTVGDWINTDEGTITTIAIHTGCDVRGGYSPPLIVRPDSDFSFPAHTVCEFWVETREGPLDMLNEKLSYGYSGCPLLELEQELDRVFHWTLSEDRTSVCARLKDGHVVRISVSAPYLGG